MSETEDLGCDYFVIARIIGMCQFYGIELDERCSILYLMLNDSRKEWDEDNKREFLRYPEGFYQECYEQVELWMGKNGDTKKLLRDRVDNYWKANRFAEFCLKRQGYQEDYLYQCNIEFMSINQLLAQTLALLKSAYPNEEFTFEEVQTYAMIAHCIDAIVSICDIYDENLTEMMGIGTGLDRSKECLFKPENIAYKEDFKEKVVIKPVHVAPIVNADVKKEDYLTEIEELRCRLRKKEEESKYFRQLYEQTKASLDDAKEAIEQNANYMKELITLRNYVYSLSQESPVIEESKLEDMKNVIAKKRIIIIGGHINWINKLKKEFSNWRFLDANISRTNDGKLVEGADIVYFFTDHLSHGTYGKFVKLVRENQIPFGYLHFVNIETLVRQVFEDLE